MKNRNFGIFFFSGSSTNVLIDTVRTERNVFIKKTGTLNIREMKCAEILMYRQIRGNLLSSLIIHGKCESGKSFNWLGPHVLAIRSDLINFSMFVSKEWWLSGRTWCLDNWLNAFESFYFLQANIKILVDRKFERSQNCSTYVSFIAFLYEIVSKSIWNDIVIDRYIWATNSTVFVNVSVCVRFFKYLFPFRPNFISCFGYISFIIEIFSFFFFLLTI